MPAETPDTRSSPAAAFDRLAGEGAYDRALAEALTVSGESKEYFAAGRVAWAARWLRGRGAPPPARVLDYGCGIGDTLPLLASAWGSTSLLGVDESRACIAAAAERHVAPGMSFCTAQDHAPAGDFDAAYVNGVFHHVPPPERAGVAAAIARSLAPGGWFFLFENNPWNPGTRFIMSRCAFDEDAVLLWPWEARRLLR